MAVVNIQLSEPKGGFYGLFWSFSNTVNCTVLKNCAKKSHLFQTRIASQTQNIFGLVSINLQLSKLKTISTFQNTVHNRVPIPLGFLIQFRHLDANHRQRPHSTTTRTFAQRNWFTRTQAFLSSGLMNKVFLAVEKPVQDSIYFFLEVNFPVQYSIHIFVAVKMPVQDSFYFYQR